MRELDLTIRGLDHTLEQIRAQRDLPSISVTIFLEGQLAWKGACGLATLQPARSANPGLVYPIGSITKVFIATMLMQLVERGIVQLDDRLVRYLPEYQVRSPFPNTPPTTLRQLADHTSGLPRDAVIRVACGDCRLQAAEKARRLLSMTSVDQNFVKLGSYRERFSFTMSGPQGRLAGTG